MSWTTFWTLEDRATAKAKKGAAEQAQAVEGVGKASAQASRKIVSHRQAEAAQANVAMKALGSMKSMLLGFATIQGVKMLASQFAGMVTEVTRVNDELAKMAKRTGTNVETLQAYRLAADKAGASVEAVATAFKFQSKAQVDAALGLKETIRGFELLNIPLDDIQGMDPEALFLRIADALDKETDAAKRSRAAMILWGESGTALLPMVATIRGAREEAEMFGLVSGNLAKGSEDYVDALRDMQAAIEGMKFRAMAENIDTITTAIDALTYSVVIQAPMLSRAFAALGHDIAALAALKDLDFSQAFIEGAKAAADYAVLVEQVAGLKTQLSPEAFAAFRGGVGRGAAAPAGAAAPSAGGSAIATETSAARDLDAELRRLAIDYDILYKRMFPAISPEVQGILPRGEAPAVDTSIPGIDRQTTDDVAAGIGEVDIALEQATLDAIDLGAAMEGVAQRGLAQAANAVGSIVAGLTSAQDAGEIFAGIARQIVAQLAAAAVFAAVLSALGLGGGKGSGGIFRSFLGFEHGGMVPRRRPEYFAAGGGPRGLDVIPAYLRQGEGVLTPQGVRAAGGPEGLRQLNRGEGGRSVSVTVPISGGTFVGPGGERAFAARLHDHLYALIRDNGRRDLTRN